MPGPHTPTQNKLMPDDSHQASPTNPFQPTPSTNRGPFPSPTIGTNATPPAKMRNGTSSPFANWDRRNPYPKTTEGKVAYEATMQAWWDRNGFNARATTADLIPLTPGTVPVGTRDCYACGWNNCGDIRFPHQSEDCTIMLKIPAQEKSWRTYCGTQARAAVMGDQPDRTSIQQVEEYGTYQEQTGQTETSWGNDGELTA